MVHDLQASLTYYDYKPGIYQNYGEEINGKKQPSEPLEKAFFAVHLVTRFPSF